MVRRNQVKSTSQIFNNKGSLIIQVLIAAVGISALALMLAQSFNQNQLNIKKADLIENIRIYRNNIVNTVENDASWVETINSNSSLNCLKTEGAVCSDSPIDISVMNSDGSFLVKNVPTEGFDIYGAACNTFTIGSGGVSSNCPFKYKVSVTPLCAGGPCPPTKISSITGLAYEPRYQVGLQLTATKTDAIPSGLRNTNYSFAFVRGLNEGTLAASCRSANGEFDPTNKQCTLTRISVCAEDHVMVGIDAKGNVICRRNRFFDSGCGPSFAYVGVDKGGDPICWKF